MLVVNVVLPILLGTWNEDKFEIKSHLGTAFLIGKGGVAITAAHVIDQMLDSDDEYAAGYMTNDGWFGVRILSFERHPEEDVAVVRLNAIRHASWLVLSTAPENQTCEYDCWGYPAFVAGMAKKFEGAEVDQPDLIYTRGYVRRRISRELPFSMYRGKAFYELSESAGDGCSGAPVLLRQVHDRETWKVFGVYIGSSEIDGVTVGYATRIESVHTWVPSILGKSILDESLTF